MANADRLAHIRNKILYDYLQQVALSNFSVGQRSKSSSSRIVRLPTINVFTNSDRPQQNLAAGLTYENAIYLCDTSDAGTADDDVAKSVEDGAASFVLPGGLTRDDVMRYGFTSLKVIHITIRQYAADVYVLGPTRYSYPSAASGHIAQDFEFV